MFAALTLAAAAFVAAATAPASAPGRLEPHRVPAIGEVAKSFPSAIRLPPFAGTRTFAFTTRARVAAMFESGEFLYFVTAAGPAVDGTVSLLALRGRSIEPVGVPGGPYRTLALTQIAETYDVLDATTGGPKPVTRHIVVTRGRVYVTRTRGNGFREDVPAGVRCLDARTSSAYNGAAVIIYDAVTAALRPSISKALLGAATEDASDDPALTIKCHSYGPDALVWLEAPLAAGRDVPLGLTLRQGNRLQPLVNVPPLATSAHYVLFEQGDAASGAPLTYTLLRSL